MCLMREQEEREEEEEEEEEQVPDTGPADDEQINQSSILYLCWQH